MSHFNNTVWTLGTVAVTLAFAVAVLLIQKLRPSIVNAGKVVLVLAVARLTGPAPVEPMPELVAGDEVDDATGELPEPVDPYCDNVQTWPTFAIGRAQVPPAGWTAEDEPEEEPANLPVPAQRRHLELVRVDEVVQQLRNDKAPIPAGSPIGAAMEREWAENPIAAGLGDPFDGHSMTTGQFRPWKELIGS